MIVFSCTPEVDDLALVINVIKDPGSFSSSPLAISSMMAYSLSLSNSRMAAMAVRIKPYSHDNNIQNKEKMTAGKRCFSHIPLVMEQKVSANVPLCPIY